MMIVLRPSPALTQYARTYLNGATQHDDTNQSLKALHKAANEEILNLAEIECIFETCCDGGVKFRDLIRGSALKFPGKSVEEKPSKQLTERRAFLKAKEQELLYSKMVEGLVSSQQDSVKSEMGSILNQSAVLVNVVIAVLASYGIGYYIGSYFTKRNNERMIFGLFAGSVALLTEMLLYILRSSAKGVSTKARS